jgi:hypothetical protein
MQNTFSPRAVVGSLAIALIVGLAVLVLQVYPASAYHLLGGRWPNQPYSGCCANIYITYSGSFISSADRTGWDNGRFAWNNTASANIFFWTTSSCCTIVAYDTNDTSTDSDGWTTLYPCGSCTYNYADLYLNYAFTKNYSSAEIQSVAAHELGHLAGLDHSSGCVLMNGSTATRWGSCGINLPQTDDVNGVNALY